MNRIAAAVAKAQTKLDTLEPAAVAELDSTLAVEFDEHFAFQRAQSHAHAAGIITADEAMIVYRALGELGSSKNGGWAAGTTTATKVAVTMAMGELLGRPRR